MRKATLLDVVRNAVCTHSHPTGLLGAVLHAQCVARALVSGKVPSLAVLEDAIGVASRLPEMIEKDRELTFWRVAFEEDAGDFGEAWTTALSEARGAVSIAAACDGGTGEERYQTIVDGLKLREPARRGSGMLTAVAAAALASSELRAVEAMRIAANTLGTDTDTIGSMAGAILGATVDADPPVDVLDATLVRSDADRVADIAAGRNPVNHQYPDLMRWQAPKTRSDALACSKDGDLVVHGLGRATPPERRGGTSGPRVQVALGEAGITDRPSWSKAESVFPAAIMCVSVVVRCGEATGRVQCKATRHVPRPHWISTRLQTP